MCSSNILFFSPEILSSSWSTGESFALHTRGFGFEPGQVEPVMLIFFCFYAVESFKECPAHHLPLSRWCRCQEFRLFFKYTQNCELKEIIHEVCEDREKFRSSKSLKFVRFPFFKGKPKANSSGIELFSS